MNTERKSGPDRRAILAGAASTLAASALAPASAQAQSAAPGPRDGDRVFLTNEDSNTHRNLIRSPAR